MPLLLAITAAIPANLIPLEKAHGVTAYSGPFLVLGMTVRANGYTASAVAEGRDQAAAAVDRPLLTAGTWARPGTVVLERSFAAALGVGVGNSVSLNGRSFHVSGIAVSAALPPYPSICAAPVCNFAVVLPASQVWPG